MSEIKRAQECLEYELEVARMIYEGGACHEYNNEIESEPISEGSNHK